MKLVGGAGGSPSPSLVEVLSKKMRGMDEEWMDHSARHVPVRDRMAFCWSEIDTNLNKVAQERFSTA